MSQWPTLSHCGKRLQKALALMSTTQPHLFERLSSVDRGLIPASHRGLLFRCGLTIWTLMRERTDRRRTAPVTPADWEYAVEQNITWFHRLTENSGLDAFEAVASSVESYNQAALLYQVIRALREASRPGAGLSEERAEMALVHLKSLIDCLDRIEAGPVRSSECHQMNGLA